MAPPPPPPTATLFDAYGNTKVVGASCVDLSNFDLSSVLSTRSVVQLFFTGACGSNQQYGGLVYPNQSATPIPANVGKEVMSALLP